MKLFRWLLLVVLLGCVSLKSVQAAEPDWLVFDRPVGRVAFSPEGRVAAAADSYGSVWFRDVNTLRSRLLHDHRANAHRGVVLAMTFSADGKKFASAGTDGSVKVWNAKTGAILKRIVTPSIVESLSFSPNGKLLAVGTDDDYPLTVWNVRTGKLLMSVPRTGFRPLVRFIDDDRILELTSSGTIRVWSFGMETLLKEWTVGQAYQIFNMAVSPDGSRVLVANRAQNSTIKSYSLEVETLGNRLTDVSSIGMVTSLVYVGDGKTIAVGHANGYVSILSSEGFLVDGFQAEKEEGDYSVDSLATAQGSVVAATRTIAVALYRGVAP